MRRALLALCLCLLSSRLFATDSADALMRRADEIRNPSASYAMRVEVETEGSDPGYSLFDVSISGDKTLVKTIEPARDRGRNLLMLGQEMWAYIPNLKRSVRVALNQKLTGQTANGDISRMRWSGDYDPSFDTSAAAGKGETVLLLKANKKGLTYDQIRVWLDTATARPLRAEFLTLAGMVLKRVTYADYGEIAGGVRPRKIIIQDAIRPSERSTIHIVSMESRDFPAALFNQNQIDH